jgi:hypothetical protein
MIHKNCETRGVSEVYFFRFRDGRITHAWGLEDNAQSMRQLGHLGDSCSRWAASVRSQAGGRSGGADLDGVFGQAPVEQPVGQADGTPAVGGE